MTGTKNKAPRRLGLEDLAHFQIRSIESSSNGWVSLKGVFDHLDGVRKNCPRGLLYVSRRNSIYGELQAINRKTREAVFLGLGTGKRLRAGMALPYVDRYFDAAQVARALEPASLWKKVKYRAQHMVRYKDPSVPGWWKSHTLEGEISPGATDIHYVEGGWDHEHCDLCREKIGHGGASRGYFKKSENAWLCQKCYKKFIARHDLRFVQFKK